MIGGSQCFEVEEHGSGVIEHRDSNLGMLGTCLMDGHDGQAWGYNTTSKKLSRLR